MRHTKSFFAHIQNRGPAAMGKNSSGAVKSERVRMAQDEDAARLERCVKALKHGVDYQDLTSRFPPKVIEAARKMMARQQDGR